MYETLLIEKGKCTVCMLAKKACISLHSARRSINLHQAGMDVMPKCQRGHGKKGVGSKKGFSVEHHAFLYDLYKRNPSMPTYGYCEEFKEKYGHSLSESFITRWFETMGPYKGSLQVTSSHPTGRYSDSTIMRLQQYTRLIESVDNHERLVFSYRSP